MASNSSVAFSGQFNDGQTAASQEVSVSFGPSGLVFGPSGKAAQSHWSYDTLRAVNPVPPSGPTWLRYETEPTARLTVESPQFANQILARAPQLGKRADIANTAKVLGWCIAGIIVFLTAGWLFISTAPMLVAKTIPHSWMAYMGEQIERSLVRNAERCDNLEGRKALARLAFRFADEIEPEVLRVYNIPFSNAFAMPGGRVVITSELIKRAKSADEVAGVLAHELGHLKARHPEAQIVRVFGIQLVMSAIWGGSGLDDALAQGSALLAILNYTRSAEEEADRLALELLRTAKISPDGLADFFETALNEPAAKFQKSLGDLGKIISSHPGLDERIKRIRAAEKGETTPSLSDVDWDRLKQICS